MAIPSVLRGTGARKLLVYVIGCLPLAGLTGALISSPPADPYELIARETGENALRLLVLTLAISPLITLTKKRWLGVYRRTLGVLSFTYAVLHFAAYIVFEADFDPTFLLTDIPERRFIAVGIIAFALMLPLGVTSNNFSVRKLGRKWKRLHRLAYPLLLLAPVHFLMLKRGEDLTEPLVYLTIAITLLAFRVVVKRRANKPAPR